MMMNLQLFATDVEKVKGTEIIYLYRLLSEKSSEAATHIAFSEENELSMKRDADTTQTKDGPIRTPGTPELEITAKSILAKGDTMIKKLKNALLSGEIVEVWRVNLAEEGTDTNAGKYEATYYQANVTELTETSNAEDACEVEITFGVQGNGADGYATVSDAQKEAASYVFKDTSKEAA
jgi:TP901-1 family phage major tail protein